MIKIIVNHIFYSILKKLYIFLECTNAYLAGGLKGGTLDRGVLFYASSKKSLPQYTLRSWKNETCSCHFHTLTQSQSGSLACELILLKKIPSKEITSTHYYLGYSRLPIPFGSLEFNQKSGGNDPCHFSSFLIQIWQLKLGQLLFSSPIFQTFILKPHHLLRQQK